MSNQIAPSGTNKKRKLREFNFLVSNEVHPFTIGSSGPPSSPIPRSQFAQYRPSPYLESMSSDSPMSKNHQSRHEKYSYDPDVLDSYQSKWLAAQARLFVNVDILNDRFTPHFDLMSEVFPHRGAVISIHIHDVLAQRPSSIVLRVYNRYSQRRPYFSFPLAVKYQSNCIGRKQVFHPLLVDYWFAKHVNENTTGIQVSPRVLFISPPALYPKKRTLKIDFDDEHFRAACYASKSTIRYMVMERTGMNLEDLLSNLPGSKMSLLEGMDLLIQLITAIELIHNLNVVHGDIHLGNIVVSHENLLPRKYLLLDYNLAYMHTGDLTNTPMRENYLYNSMFSFWEIEGYKSSYRDDVQRAVLCVRDMIGGMSIHYERINRARFGLTDKQYHEWLKFGNIFTSIQRPTMDVFTSSTDVNPAKRTQIVSLLQEISSLSGCLTCDINDRPPYARIIYCAKEIKFALLNNPPITPETTAP